MKKSIVVFAFLAFCIKSGPYSAFAQEDLLKQNENLIKETQKEFLQNKHQQNNHKIFKEMVGNNIFVQALSAAQDLSTTNINDMDQKIEAEKLSNETYKEISPILNKSSQQESEYAKSLLSSIKNQDIDCSKFKKEDHLGKWKKINVKKTRILRDVPITEKCQQLRNQYQCQKELKIECLELDGSVCVRFKEKWEEVCQHISY